MNFQEDTTFEGAIVNERHEVITMHLFDSDVRVEAALCEAESSVHSRTILQDYLERRMDDLPVPTTCGQCKALAVPWAVNRYRQLEAQAGDLRVKAERLRLRDAARYPNSIEEAESESASLEDQAHDLRELADSLAVELGIKPQR